MKENPTSPVGIKLRDERLRLGLTQAEAAACGGVTREQWGRYERGAMPNTKVLVSLKGHGFDVSHILEGDRDTNLLTLSAEEHALLGVFRCTDDEGRAAVLRQARMEAQRVEGVHVSFAPREPAPPLVLHDAPRKRVR